MKKKEKNRNWKSKSISKPSTNLKGNITAFVQIEEANRKRNPHTFKKYKKNTTLSCCIGNRVLNWKFIVKTTITRRKIQHFLNLYMCAECIAAWPFRTYKSINFVYLVFIFIFSFFYPSPSLFLYLCLVFLPLFYVYLWYNPTNTFILVNR